MTPQKWVQLPHLLASLGPNSPAPQFSQQHCLQDGCSVQSPVWTVSPGPAPVPPAEYGGALIVSVCAVLLKEELCLSSAVSCFSVNQFLNLSAWKKNGVSTWLAQFCSVQTTTVSEGSCSIFPAYEICWPCSYQQIKVRQVVGFFFCCFVFLFSPLQKRVFMKTIVSKLVLFGFYRQFQYNKR